MTAIGSGLTVITNGGPLDAEANLVLGVAPGGGIRVVDRRAIGPVEDDAATGERQDGCVRERSRHEDRNWAHHVHLFMAEDVAVPHIFPAEVDDVINDRRDGDAVGVGVVEPGFLPVEAVLCSPGADGHHRVERTLAVGDAERDALGTIGRIATIGVLERVDPHGVLPAELIGIGRTDDVVPGDAVDQLNIVQVEVDRVRIHAVVGDLPDLGPIGSRGNGGHVQAARHPGCVQDLGRRVHVGVEDDVLR